MLLLNELPSHNQPLSADDGDLLGRAGAEAAMRFLRYRKATTPTPLHSVAAFADKVGVEAVHVKDESSRLGLGSFKALGGAYAVMKIVLERAGEVLGRDVGFEELGSAAVRRIARDITVACATDGNHGRSVAQGAALVGAQSVIFMHAGVSDERAEAVARLGADIVRVQGTYDDSVEFASRRCAENGWIVVSDTSWPGYERVPGLVMQGYTVMIREALDALPQLPTHVFIQAGVGGLAAAVAGHLAIEFGPRRPTIVVVEPERAACIFKSARAGRPLKIVHGAPTVMAMLECYEPSLVAWRILSRVADAFMTVGEDDAVAIMNRLARPSGDDPIIIAGESGGVGLAGLVKVAADDAARAAIALDKSSRVLVINTEGATDEARYAQLVGMTASSLAIDAQSKTGKTQTSFGPVSYVPEGR
jgi:diaminopropionate ammonia-lyase